jgi:hypothetical protein
VVCIYRPEGSSERIFLVMDVRGESETYTRWLMVGYRGGRRTWTEGVRKDRSQMHPTLRAAIEAHIGA